MIQDSKENSCEKRGYHVFHAYKTFDAIYFLEVLSSILTRLITILEYLFGQTYIIVERWRNFHEWNKSLGRGYFIVRVLNLNLKSLF